MARITLLSFAALLVAADLARGGEIRLEIPPGRDAEAVLKQVRAATGIGLLYAPEDLAGRKVAGRIDVALPARHAGRVALFALGACDLDADALAGEPALIVVRPARPLLTAFRLAGLDVVLQFNRSPGSWTTAADRADSLAAETIAALRERLARGRPDDQAAAAHLLGRFGPRDRATVDALAEALGAADQGVRERAVGALARIGYFARPALPALEKLRPRPTAVIEALRDSIHPALLAPDRATQRAPSTFTVVFETTKGSFDVEVVRAWSPAGVDRFYNLVVLGFFDDTAFFRMVPGFVTQFGLSGRPEVNRVWRNATILDDPVKESNRRGTLSFAKRDANTRTTQIFINLADNTSLDRSGFSPFARITSGMDVVGKLFDGYREKPDQGRIHFDGNAYLKKEFPRLDFIKTARVKH